MDEFQYRMISSLNDRHQRQIQKLADSIEGNISYFLRDLGNPKNAGEAYMRNIERDAQEILCRLAALDAVKEVIEVVQSREPDHARTHPNLGCADVGCNQAH